MTAGSLLAYAIALVLAVATPGPAMIALIARSAARGAGSGLRMALGIALADVMLGALALLGLVALLNAHASLLVVLKYAAATYLVWLGARMWRSQPGEQPASAGPRANDLVTGLTVGLSNPKAMLFHASLMPLIIDLRLLDWPSGLTIVAIIFTANLSVMSAYAITAGTGGQRFRSSSRLQSMNRIAGGAMIGAGAAIAVR